MCRLYPTRGSEAGRRRYAPRMSDSGVVDPVRIPDWIREPAARAWRELPPLARVFVVLTLLDILGRSLGILGPTIDWAYVTPLSFVSAFLPHDLWILLPALLVVRRPDAASAMPWIFRGALVIAIAELVTGPVRGLLGLDVAAATMSALVLAASSVAMLAGWLLIGWGLAALTARDPGETAAVLANVSAAAVGLLAAIGLARILTSAPPDTGEPAFSQAMTLGSLAAALRLLGWAYLVWVVVRGFGDPRRPRAATMTAAVGAVLAGLVPLFTELTYSLLGAAGFDFSSPSGLQEVLIIIGWLGYVLGPSLVVASLGIGLADPPFPYAPPAAPAPVPASAATAPPLVGTAEPPDEEPAILPE